MNFKNLRAFALAPQNFGELNQLRGALNAISEIASNKDDVDSHFLLPKGVTSASDIRKDLFYSNFCNYNEFCKEIHDLLDKYFETNKIVPKIFITAYTQALNDLAQENVDMLCRSVKEYYEQHNFGSLLTAVLNSRVHEYKYVDLMTIPDHMLNLKARIELLQNEKLSKKTLITLGIINNFSIKNVETNLKELSEKLKNLKDKPEFFDWIYKFENFVKISKKVVISLGGRVPGPEIIFDLNYAKKLFSDADILYKNGYGIVFINGSRTPNDVTDYIYEQSLRHPGIIFQNCKKIANNDIDRQPENWRIYSGRNEDVFRQFEQIGNIYPAVIGYENTLVVCTADSFSSCETASASIPTAISSKGLFIDPQVRYDCINLQRLMCPEYAIDWDEFVSLACKQKTEPKNLGLKILPNPVHNFTETVLKMLNEM